MKSLLLVGAALLVGTSAIAEQWQGAPSLPAPSDTRGLAAGPATKRQAAEAPFLGDFDAVAAAFREFREEHQDEWQ